VTKTRIVNKLSSEESRRTRIVCTLGPASNTEEILKQLIHAGMNVARFNFSHGDHAMHRQTFERLRKVCAELGRPVAVLQDLCGPKIRLGEMQDGTVIEDGQTFVLSSEPRVGNAEGGHVTYPSLHEDLKAGDKVLINDGLLELTVEKIEGTNVVCRVIHGGVVKSRKGVNLPGARLSVPALTEKDEADLRFGLELGVDIVALSFVRSPHDVDKVRKIMAEVGVHRPVCVKIEKAEAVVVLEDIVKSADAVMVARGDLGIEIPIEEVPMVQKAAIRLGILHNRPVITATQMLESMMSAPTPTRAEVTDIANAILDGTDAVMLSGETAAGEFPVRAVQVMHRVALRAEQALDYRAVLSAVVPEGQSELAVALAACEIAEEVGARAILACTYNGKTVRRIARYRPRAPILAVSASEELARQLLIVWGATPIAIGVFDTTDQLVASAVEAGRKSGILGPGDKVVIVAGMPMGSPTNMIMVQELD